jgi:hypothetical protein
MSAENLDSLPEDGSVFDVDIQSCSRCRQGGDLTPQCTCFFTQVPGSRSQDASVVDIGPAPGQGQSVDVADRGHDDEEEEVEQFGGYEHIWEFREGGMCS